MFQNLRINNPFFIFHKDTTPYLETGTVVSVTAPMPQFSAIGQPTSYTVDVTVRVNDNNITYQKLPANMDVADFGGNGNVVVAASKDAMNGELQSMRQRSVDVIKSVSYHENVVQILDKILQTLNPEVAEKMAQQEEINSLKAQMSAMSQNMSDLMAMNKELMEQIRGSRNNDRNKNKD